MQPIFIDPSQQKALETDGFVKINVLDNVQVETLFNYYQSLGLQDEMGYGFHISLNQTDKALVENINAKIYEIALPALKPLFQNAKAFTASFVIKDPNSKGVVPVHQDWTFVADEQNHCSLTCWIPLVDVDMNNGALGVIRGSHRFLDHTRPSPSPHVPTPIGKHMFSIFPYVEIIEMKAGEALIFDNRLFHASPPNTTAHSRIAVGVGITQQEAELRHHFLKPNGQKDTLMSYAVDESFYLKYDNSQLASFYENGQSIPGYELLGEKPYNFQELEQDALLEQIKAAGNSINEKLILKLAKLFDYNLDGTKKQEEEVAFSQTEVIENRPFWQIYTPLNIIREIRYRLSRLGSSN